MNYAEAVNFLLELRQFGSKLGLEKVSEVARRAGNPHQKLRFVHVAGTNGKGSICAMLESIYRAAGLRVGLFTSPHLVSFRERIQVNRELIEEDSVVRLAGSLPPLMESLAADSKLTFFEAVTIMALRYFVERECDLVVWETGLGGRLDATNIVHPLVSVITNVQFDHEKWLGTTLSQIAGEKAGIIKPGVPVVTGTSENEALDVIMQVARQNQAPLTVVSRRDLDLPPLPTLTIPLPGAHQRWNAAVALATTRVLEPQIPVALEAQVRGLQSVQWSGRLQEVCRGNQRILLDGAHNPAGAETLRAAARDIFPSAEVGLIIGVMQDKDQPAMLDLLAPLAQSIWLVPVSSERTSDPSDLALLAAKANTTASLSVCRSLREALDRSQACSNLIITGSLHLVGEAMEILGVGLPCPGERALNESMPLSHLH